MGRYVSTIGSGVERRYDPSRKLQVQIKDGKLRGPRVSTRGPNIVDPQRFEIPNVKPAVSDHWISKRFLRHLPRLFFLRWIRRREAAFFAIAFRSCFH